ncbi:MAG TPA: lysylphosphatidylglycerol synthase transmembrane domain-containing protein [Geminicoccus sp.]|jgi:hypothetical protein|uniref:lysylphosphatidylglycerol synthase transmembrane domain-containing protein n=1 Tax=Geminicoccus sp. TaxID=2024832 RepID=UPI002E373971|nr:lysylphosphatidylglycerol synthase transmembrane domain-containing protein [Geminicoccus sp.]HEX2526051.1 lysylphosphatidylglycerol synthase transmembrane domain-containing protein [Geminicoccus sp.]
MGRGLKAFLGIAFSLVLLGLLIWWQPMDEYLAVWQQATLWPIAVVFLLTIPMVMLRARQTQSLARLQGMQVGFGPLVGLQLATTFYGLFVPGVVAVGVLRWYRLAKLGGDPKATMALVVFSRLLEIEMALLLGLIFWMLDPLAPGSPGLPITFFLIWAVTALTRFAAFHPWTANRLEGLIVAYWPAQRLGGIRSRLIGLLGVTARYGTLTGRAWATLLTNVLASNALGLLSASLAAMAVGMEVSLITLGWARAILALALLLPITWAGIGLREATLAGALVAAGQPAAASVALGLLLSLRVVLEAAAGGLVELHAWLSPSPQQRSNP